MRKWLLWSLSFWILNADCLTTGWHQRQMDYSKPTSSSSRGFKHARNLIVVLPVLHGYDNISQEKLQYLYTKPPVTVLVEDTTSSQDAQHTQHRPFYHTYPGISEPSLRARPNVVSKQNPMRTFESMKKPSRPLPPPSINHLEPIDSDTRYLDIFDTMTLPKEKFFDNRRVKANRKEYEYPISFNSHKFIVSTSQTPTVEYPTNMVDSNWKAIFVNYSDSSLSDSSEENFEDASSNSTEATDKIISILAQLGYLSSINTTGAKAEHNSDGDVSWKRTDSNYLSSFKMIPANYVSKMPPPSSSSSTKDDVQKILHSLGLLRGKRQNAVDSSSSARIKRKARDDTTTPALSTTTESTRSRVLRYMLANPRIKSVHELFQVIRNTVNVPLPTSPQRMGKSSKTNGTDAGDTDVPSTRQGFGDDGNATFANTTIVAGASNETEMSTRATSLNDVDAPSPSEQASSTPPNGVYFYVDWNSFLNMTPSSGDPISLNFAPKAGNRRFFTRIETFNRLAGVA